MTAVRSGRQDHRLRFTVTPPDRTRPIMEPATEIRTPRPPAPMVRRRTTSDPPRPRRTDRPAPLAQRRRRARVTDLNDTTKISSKRPISITTKVKDYKPLFFWSPLQSLCYKWGGNDEKMWKDFGFWISVDFLAFPGLSLGPVGRSAIPKDGIAILRSSAVSVIWSPRGGLL